MPHINEALYMGSQGFSRRVRFTTTTPSSLFGKCETKSLYMSGMDANSGPSIGISQSHPNKDPSHRDSIQVAYYLSDADFDRLNWLRLSDRIVSWMSVFFGKQMSHPDITQVNGNWKQTAAGGLPEKIWNRELPFYSDRTRKDFAVKLDLSSLGELEALVYSIDPVAKKLNTAAEFYASSLRKWLSEPERAYLDLITAGECLVDLQSYEWDDIADTESKKMVEALMDSGNDSLVRFYKGRATFISKRYVEILTKNIPDSILSEDEYATEENVRICTDSISAGLKKAYHLRSAFVHDGAEFGIYTSILAARSKAEIWHDFQSSVNKHGHSEADGASKTMSDRQIRQIGKAATFIGLERITRAAILSLYHKHKSSVVDGCNGRINGPLSRDRQVLGEWIKMHPEDAEQLNINKGK